jgi:hypothetical protein
LIRDEDASTRKIGQPRLLRKADKAAKTISDLVENDLEAISDPVDNDLETISDLVDNGLETISDSSDETPWETSSDFDKFAKNTVGNDLETISDPVDNDLETISDRSDETPEPRRKRLATLISLRRTPILIK